MFVSKSIYKCDRCKKESTKGMYAIFIRIPGKKETPKKRWDLCSRCYRMLEKGIAKGGTDEC